MRDERRAFQKKAENALGRAGAEDGRAARKEQRFRRIREKQRDFFR